MASLLLLLHLLVNLLVMPTLQLSSSADGTMMEEEELVGLFEVMGSLLEEPSWAQDHPQPCTNTPWPGIECESEVGGDPPIFHVTKIHIAPDLVTPLCKPSANLSESFRKLPFLKTLSIFNCFLTSPVTLSASSFSSLEHLVLQSNPALSGEIPPSLSKLKNLRVLSLSQNNLEGNIPREIGWLFNLEQLDLSYNNLTGEIPEDVGGLKSLTILDLSRNFLEGNLPSSLGHLHLLQKIDLGFNRFNGTIPSDLGDLKRLVLLDLTQNLLTGPLPEDLSGLKELEYLVMDNNPINSRIPLFLGTLERLKCLSLSSSGMRGSLPDFLSSLTNLSALSLGNNSLTGTIPPDIGSLPYLDELNLSYNKLSGELRIPEKFIDRLGKRLDISGNEGICTGNQSYKKSITSYLKIPSCLNASKTSHGKIWPGEEDHPSDVSGTKLLWSLGSFVSRIVVFVFVILR